MSASHPSDDGLTATYKTTPCPLLKKEGAYPIFDGICRGGFETPVSADSPPGKKSDREKEGVYPIFDGICRDNS